MAARLGLQIYEWVNRFARKLAAKPGKEGIMTIPNQETVRDLSNEILTKFMKYNVPREALQSENDIKVIYNQIKNIEEQTLARNLKKELTPKKVAPVLDLTGKKIDTSKPILGGKNVPESEAQIKTKLEGMNKKTVERIRRRRYEAALKEERRKMAKDPEYIPKILDPDDFADGGLAPLLGEPTYADGGRIGFKLGGIDKARRAFLKWAGAGAAGIGAAKSGLLGLLKSGKPITGVVTSVPIKSGVDGMPAWFKPLVNKVIKEGTEVPSGAERVIVHKTKLPDSKTDIYVEQDLNTGNVVVDIGAGKHGFSAGYHGQPVRLEYKASEVIEPNPAGSGFITSKGQVTSTGISKGKMTDKGMKTKEEFWVEEAEFTGGHPENIKYEDVTIEKYGEHGSDFSEVEKFATGKTTKASKKGSKEVWEADWDDSLPDDYASGGRVPFGRGYLVGGAKSLGKKYKGSTLAAILENPKLLGAELGHDGIMQLMQLLGMFSEGGRVPLAGGKSPDPSDATTTQLLDILFDEGFDMEGILRLLKQSQVGNQGDFSSGYQSTWRKAQGGRVPFSKGKKVVEGLAWLANKIAPGSTKVGQTSKPMAPKTELKRAIAGFQEREAAAKLKEMIKNKYQGRIDDDLLNKILVDDNPQRIAEVLATIDEALIMQGKGMGPDQVIQTIKESWKRKPQATGGRVPFFAGSIAKLGKFSKAEVLLQMFENTIKQSKSANTKKRFTNFIKEIKAKPELANDPEVWGFFTKGLPKNQRLVVHSDDTVDFWRQSDFGPHNIKTTDKFMKKHPHLSRDEAVRIQNMEPEDQILEMKRLETIRNRTKQAYGGLAGMLGE